MATVTRTGNAYQITAGENESVRLDRPIKKAQIGDAVVEFPSIYGYPITLIPDMLAPNVIVHEYGEVANENYWNEVTIPQGV